MARKDSLTVKELREILEQCPDDMQVGTSFWGLNEFVTLKHLEVMQGILKDGTIVLSINREKYSWSAEMIEIYPFEK